MDFILTFLSIRNSLELREVEIGNNTIIFLGTSASSKEAKRGNVVESGESKVEAACLGKRVNISAANLCCY